MLKKKTKTSKILLIVVLIINFLFLDNDFFFFFLFFFFNDTATTEIYTGWYTLSHTTLFRSVDGRQRSRRHLQSFRFRGNRKNETDRKSTRLNSSHTIQSRMPSSA